MDKYNTIQIKMLNTEYHREINIKVLLYFVSLTKGNE